MTAATILPVPTEKGGILYRGLAGDKHSEGSTVGEALVSTSRRRGGKRPVWEAPFG